MRQPPLDIMYLIDGDNMRLLHKAYRGFQIQVSATKAAYDGLWIGHYEINGAHHGIASGSLSGPHTSAQDAIDNALRTAKGFVDSVID